MTSARVEPEPRGLLLACPEVDLESARAVYAAYGCVLLPAGSVGDLAGCEVSTPLYLLAIGDSGAGPAATWRARLLGSLPLTAPDPARLLPASWTARHPDAYALARSTGRDPADSPDDPEQDPEEDPTDDVDDEPVPQQVFIPISDLAPLPRSEWLFTNELVPKRERGGRRFAPRAPTLVTLPL